MTWPPAGRIQNLRKRIEHTLSDPCTIHRQSIVGTDAEGNTNVSVVDTEIMGRLVPSSTSESTEGRPRWEVELVLPPDVEVDHSDAVTVAGRRYLVDGPPIAHPSPAIATHLRVGLIREGA